MPTLTRGQARSARWERDHGIRRARGFDIAETCRRCTLAGVSCADLSGAFGASERPPKTLGNPSTMFWKFRGTDGRRWTVYDRKGSARDNVFGIGGEVGSDPEPFINLVLDALPQATTMSRLQ